MIPVKRIWKEHHVKWGKRAGTVEIREPYLYGDGFYRVADMTIEGHNKDENAIKVKTLDEVASYVGRGFGVRMRSGVGKPSLNSSTDMQVER